MSKWGMVKLGDVCLIERGGSPRPIDKYITTAEDGINWIKIGDTTDSMYITKTKEKIIREGMKKSRFVNVGDFLLSNSMSFGRPYILKIEGCIHDGWLVIRDERNLFEKRFLYYFLSSPITYNKFKQLAVGGVVNNLNSEMVRKVNVPIPPFEEQKRIADILDKASNLIDLRKQQLEKMDLLIKSKFIDMFGDPRNGKYSAKTLPEIVSRDKNSIKRGPFGGSLKKEDFVEKGYLIYEQRHAIYSDFSYEKYYIPKKKYEEMLGFSVKPKDLIISCSGTLGRIAEIPLSAKDGIINQALLKIKLDNSIINNIYFMQIFRDNFIQDMLFGVSRGSGICNFPSMTEVKKIKFMCPPIELQNNFAEFVEQVENQKAVMQQSLEKMETNYKALMQEYFG